MVNFNGLCFMKLDMVQAPQAWLDPCGRCGCASHGTVCGRNKHNRWLSTHHNTPPHRLCPHSKQLVHAVGRLLLLLLLLLPLRLLVLLSMCVRLAQLGSLTLAGAWLLGWVRRLGPRPCRQSGQHSAI